MRPSTLRLVIASGLAGVGPGRVVTEEDQGDPSSSARLAAEQFTLSLAALAIGAQLEVPVQSVPPEDANEHLGWLGTFFAADIPASSALTRRLLGWDPTHPGLVADLEAGHDT